MLEKSNKKIYKLYFVYLVSAVLLLTIRISSGLGILGNLNVILYDVVYSCIIQIGVIFIIPLVLYCALNKVKPTYVFDMCHYKKISLKVVFISILIGFLAFVVNIIVSSFFEGIISLFGYQGMGGGQDRVTLAQFLVSIFTTALLPAICEEFLHRGLLLQGSRHIGFKKSILISSICFGLLHFNIEQISFAIVGGLIMAYVAVVSKNIWPAVIIHFTNNFVSSYISFASSNNLLFGNIFSVINTLMTKMGVVVNIICVALITMGTVIAIIMLCNVLYKIQIQNKVLDTVKNARAQANFKLDDNSVYEMIQGNTVLNLTPKVSDDPIDRVLPKQKDVYKPRLKDNVCLITFIVLASIVTVFTFVWGFI